MALVLDLDPDLGWGLGEEEWDAARLACRGEFVRVPAGEWRSPASADASDDLLGFLIARGLLCREIALRDRHMVELLGPGDVLVPPPVAGAPRLGGRIDLTALRETLLIELGVSFLQACARWPVLLARWARRLEVQRQHAAVQGLIAHLPREEHRLVLILWHLADRWGRVTPTGTVLPLPLTHDLLGCLTAAQRPTASIAVNALESDGAIRRLPDGSWLLTATAERMVDEIALPGESPHAIGRSLMFRQRLADARAETRALRAEAEQARARRREHARRRQSGPFVGATHGVVIDAPSGEIGEVGRLSSRDGLERPARRAAEAGEAAAKRAEQARERGQAAAARAAELGEKRAHSHERGREAAERASSAGDAAKTAEARAAVALERAAEAYERAARAHERAAELADRYGGEVEAPPHRRAANQAHQAARSARDAAIQARHRLRTDPSPKPT